MLVVYIQTAIFGRLFEYIMTEPTKKVLLRTDERSSLYWLFHSSFMIHAVSRQPQPRDAHSRAVDHDRLLLPCKSGSRRGLVHRHEGHRVGLSPATGSCLEGVHPDARTPSLCQTHCGHGALVTPEVLVGGTRPCARGAAARSRPLRPVPLKPSNAG